MILIIGVRFRKSGKIYYFDPTGFTVKKGDHVIVETARGVEYGLVVLSPREIPEDKVFSPLKPIMRVATPKDDEINEDNQNREKEAYEICLEKIAKHDLKMKLIDSEYTFDRNKLLFYFTADGRIDFRELVKDLAAVFRTRIELRQIGVRDETKMIGGIAICGRPLCCHSYLSDFAPVSIKMAKEQNLSLNPSKISGVCGRLMCCLKNEQDAYEYLNSTLPAIGAHVKTSDGYRGEVQNISVLKQMVKVIISKDNDEKEVREYPVSELSFDSRLLRKGSLASTPYIAEDIDEEELEQLQIMEKEDLEELSEETEGAEAAKKQAGHPPKRSKNQKNDYNRNDYGKKERNRYERNKNDYNKGDFSKGEHGRGEYNKNYRNNNKKLKEYNYSSKRSYSTHRKNPNPRDRNQEESSE